MVLDLRVYERTVDFGGDAARDGLDEERNGGVLDVWVMSVALQEQKLGERLLPVTSARIRTVKRLPSV